MRSASARPASPVAALALPELSTTAAALAVGEVEAADLHRRGRGEVGGEHARGRAPAAVGGGDEREVGVARRLDAARDARGLEPVDGGDAHRSCSWRLRPGREPARRLAHGIIPTSREPGRLGQAEHEVGACTAWPDAPLTRLSIAPIASTVPVRSSKRAVTWHEFAPSVALVAGGSSTTTTNGSPA